MSARAISDVVVTAPDPLLDAARVLATAATAVIGTPTSIVELAEVRRQAPDPAIGGGA